IIIVDDEWLIRSELKTMLSQYPNINVVGEAATIEEAIHLIDKFKPDVLFLDIQLSDGSGFDLLNQVEPNFKVVFVSAYDQYREEARKFKAEAYLMKPISKDWLAKVINKL
ncbi:MAG: response regulator, partial [candidate division KSB1 bacterium]|nr:response regulator [candidate division KSB1 bacterium]